MSAHADRRHRLAATLVDRDLAGLVITDLVNVRYLSGFTGSNGALLVPVDGDAAIFTDGRYRDQVAQESPDLEAVIGRDLLGGMGVAMAPGTWGVETHVLSVDDHQRLADATSTTLIAAGRPVEMLREVKDEAEVASLREACRLSTEALQWLWEQPLVGRTERQIARSLELRMLDLGADAVAFDTIVAAGENSAIPHHSPTDRVLARGDLLKTDFGALVDGYHADCTRTAVVGPAAGWQREIHAAVRQSQQAGVALCTEGTAIADIDRASRGSLAASGWLEHFTTGLGHGVGLRIHEDPSVAAANAGRLVARVVLTVEPGIYLPGRGGVRIEDTVNVTSAPGHPEVLTAMTTELMEI